VIFEDTGLEGLVVVELERVPDERGSFARTFDAAEWAARSLDPRVAQCSVSRNHRRGTLRGLHYQAHPHEEVKLVRCSRGAIFDVAVDVRPASPTYCAWYGTELSDENGRMLYVPAGFAHGFVTLADATQVEYQISTAYVASHARGARWDDPAFGIRWPVAPEVMSERDRTYPDFAP